MKKFSLKTVHRKLLADTLTPVNIYLKLRDVFAGSILLESSDYHGNENSLSFICCEPLASFKVNNQQVDIRYPDGSREVSEVSGSITQNLEQFLSCFEEDKSLQSKYNPSGLFGYISYDAVRFFEDVAITKTDTSIPDILYKLYRYVIVVDHFSNELNLFEHRIENNSTNYNLTENLDRLQQIIYSNRVATYQFSKTGEEQSNFTDKEFLEVIEKGKQHCYRGDVFQIVLSRRYISSFRGDEFNVYRALRSINPSPYLFYFDYGSFKLFGSSPEAQIQIQNGKAFIYPIAGTFKRSGNDQEDLALAKKLSADEKENAEHVMLVDLARNDMSRHATDVSVEVFKEVQFYSHVIHLVSKVSGKLSEGVSALQMAADTFPAGTLSGAPKHEAMKWIDRYENVNRGFYGGAIGFIGFNNSFNHAIMIRTFLSANNTLTCQAGAGVVAKSSAESELQEVNNKLSALRKAIELAEKFRLMKILVLDNYDSFTYNLVHIIRALGYEMDIYRNDKLSVEEIKVYDKILLSPGPGIPNEAGIMKQLIKEYAASKSILGICLGHQGIAEVFGASLYNIPKVLHGVTSLSTIVDTEEYLFKNISTEFEATHYHSWAVVPESISDELKVTAVNSEGLVMGLRHIKYNVRGLQFHPESIMTPQGPKMIENWLKY